jgi:MFS family permease
VGQAVDGYDIYLPLVVLPPALIYFQPSTLPAAAKATLLYVVLATTLIGRPLGSVIFGHVGDRLGRKRTTLVAVAGFTACTALIAIMPGYATWGYAAIALFTLLRFANGIFLGGEYTAANPLAMEYSPKRLRGLMGGLIQAGYPVAFIAISLLTTASLAVAPLRGGVDSPYVQWGWRIPFVVGVLAGIAVLVYYSRSVEESRLWRAVSQERPVRAPLGSLFRGPNLRRLAQVFVLMSGFWFGNQVALVVPPVILETVLKLPAADVTHGIVVSYVFLLAGYFVMAYLGQRVGRRPMLILAGFWITFASTAASYLMVRTAAPNGSVLPPMVFETILLVLTIAPFAITISYLNERFPTSIRSSGYGVGYSLALIIPSFYSFYLLGLARLMPYAYTPMVLCVVAGILICVGAWIGPETRDVDLEGLEEPVEPRRSLPAGR